MPSARERLDHLLELAERGPTMRAALAEEVADLLLDWPQDCPVAMRAPCEALLERAACEIDWAARARLAKRMETNPDLPVRFLSALFFHASGQLKAHILARNQAADLPSYTGSTDEAALLAAARSGHSLGGKFARILGIPDETAQSILADTSGHSLAVACKGAHVSRAAFSALAVLIVKDGAAKWLESYEAVPQQAAERLMQYWRGGNSPFSAAAE
jgi:hypothetical protein